MKASLFLKSKLFITIVFMVVAIILIFFGYSYTSQPHNIIKKVSSNASITSSSVDFLAYRDVLSGKDFHIGQNYDDSDDISKKIKAKNEANNIVRYLRDYIVVIRGTANERNLTGKEKTIFDIFTRKGDLIKSIEMDNSMFEFGSSTPLGFDDLNDEYFRTFEATTGNRLLTYVPSLWRRVNSGTYTLLEFDDIGVHFVKKITLPDQSLFFQVVDDITMFDGGNYMAIATNSSGPCDTIVFNCHPLIMIYKIDSGSPILVDSIKFTDLKYVKYFQEGSFRLINEKTLYFFTNNPDKSNTNLHQPLYSYQIK